MTNRFASAEFGVLVHRAAVRVGSKTLLGERTGMSKQDIIEVTTGHAGRLEKQVLKDLALSCEPELGTATVGVMLELVEKIHPETILPGERIANPLSLAERR